MAAAINPPPDIERGNDSVTYRLRRFPSECCIYSVPNRMRNVNERAYTFQLISIGVLNYDKNIIRYHKRRTMTHFREITDLTFEDLEIVVKGMIKRIYLCYMPFIDSPIPTGFTIMTGPATLDAVFIIEILLRFYSNDFDEENEPFTKPGFIQTTVQDLLLLENQIPFFVVEAIYERAKGAGSLSPSLQGLSLTKLAYKFFRYYLGFEEADESRTMVYPKFLHFVDLGRNLCIPKEKLQRLNQADEAEAPRKVVAGRINQAGDRQISMSRFHLSSSKQDHKGQSTKKFNVPTVTRLHRAGVKLKVGSDKTLQMNFVNGILELPKLFINDHTEVFLRNVIAFEQCHYDILMVTNYFVVLKRLVDTHQDLELLVEYGIIDSMLAISEVFKLITTLTDEVRVEYTDVELINLCKDMEDYCKVTWNQWKTNLKQSYFDTPWTTISVIVATIILILTFIQAVCSILSLKSH